MGARQTGFRKTCCGHEWQGSFAETLNSYAPLRGLAGRFCARIDSLGIWQWKADYSDPKRVGRMGVLVFDSASRDKAAEIERYMLSRRLRRISRCSYKLMERGASPRMRMSTRTKKEKTKSKTAPFVKPNPKGCA